MLVYAFSHVPVAWDSEESYASSSMMCDRDRLDPGGGQQVCSMLIGASTCCFGRNREILVLVFSGVPVSIGNSRNGVILADELRRCELVLVAEPVDCDSAIVKAVRQIEV